MGEEADWMVENAAEYGWWTTDRTGVLQGHLVHETEKALLIDVDGCEVWLPKSQIKSQRLQDDGTFRFVLPGWLYEAKLDEIAAKREPLDDEIPF